MGRLFARLLLCLVLAPTLVVALYRFVDPPLTPLMGLRLVQGDGLERRWVPLAQISPHLVGAVIAAEDNRFCRHHGFDLSALVEQIQVWRAGGTPRGASTITMQTAKNLLLWPGRDPLRKVFEMLLTPQIELLWSKQRILEVYLNVAETGRGRFGAEAAARAYFGRSARDIGRHESALIAAILPNPRMWSPARPTAYLRHRAGVIAQRIDQIGDLLDCASADRSGR
jgi:monofunctional biosynthetic peptidoglycan transglycosylase